MMHCHLYISTKPLQGVLQTEGQSAVPGALPGKVRLAAIMCNLRQPGCKLHVHQALHLHSLCDVPWWLLSFVLP